MSIEEGPPRPTCTPESRGRRGLRLGRTLSAWLVAFTLLPAAGFACSVCFGAGTGDNPNAAGLNAGVGVLFAVLLPIQLLLLFLFVRILRRSRDFEDVAPVDGDRPL